MKFYIKPQRHGSPRPTGSKLYLIEILHQTTTHRETPVKMYRCILLKFYIKPQPIPIAASRRRSCILLKFYIKPQLMSGILAADDRCILLKFYIKPQLRLCVQPTFRVVSYWNSTSNHNWMCILVIWIEVVSYWNSTSNHNCQRRGCKSVCVVSYWNSTSNHNFKSVWSCYFVLYLIEILHQTTT